MLHNFFSECTGVDNCHNNQTFNLRVLVSNFTEEQLDRYEMYRRSAFPKAAIKRVSYHMFLPCFLSGNDLRAMFFCHIVKNHET